MNALARARGQIIFLIGLLLASGVVVWLDRQECVPASDIEPAPRLISTPAAETRAAWAYFERNRNATTGLVNGNERSGWTTVADEGYALKAAMAAHRLGLINGRELYSQLAQPLKTLSTVSPQQAGVRLETSTAKPAASVATGSGAEPLVSALELIAWSYPANRAAAAKELERWRQVHSAVATSSVPSDAARHSMLLTRAALAPRGEH